MTSNKIDRLNAENLESRVAPVTCDQPGGSDGHRQNEWKKGLVCEDPIVTPPGGSPGGPIEEPIL